MADDRSLEWSVWLAKRDPVRAAGTVLLALAAGGLAAYVFRSPVAAVVAAALLLGAVGEFLLPVEYRLTAEGAEARNLCYWRKIAWTEVKRVALGEEGIKLSPLACDSPREAFRGVLLRFAGNRQDVIAAVQRFRDAAP